MKCFELIIQFSFSFAASMNSLNWAITCLFTSKEEVDFHREMEVNTCLIDSHNQNSSQCIGNHLFFGFGLILKNLQILGHLFGKVEPKSHHEKSLSSHLYLFRLYLYEVLFDVTHLMLNAHKLIDENQLCICFQLERNLYLFFKFGSNLRKFQNSQRFHSCSFWWRKLSRTFYNRQTHTLL